MVYRARAYDNRSENLKYANQNIEFTEMTKWANWIFTGFAVTGWLLLLVAAVDAILFNGYLMIGIMERL